MDESKVKQLIQDALSQSRFNVSNIPNHVHNNIDAPNVPFANISGIPNSFCVATPTIGTTSTFIFGANGLNYDITITGVFLISNDTTAGNITLKNNGATVATIAKGTTAGAMVGATSLSNTAYSKGNPLTLVSSSAGNATVFLTFIST